MTHPLPTAWYLWIGISVLLFSIVGQRCYSNLAKRRFGHGPRADARFIDLGRMAIMRWENEGGAMPEVQPIGPPKPD